ncbi:hypothetical protein VPNG_03655 [Cytospora leucostoma]|uniref:Protein kinase domain-containing protein n=1 Tax=Cytospora leucostoma TaxID=1230097 RepID=A0A423XCX4_9PEZI|nr:hypothetical protein VPNG_03655 [Cytospora leucostoma]
MFGYLRRLALLACGAPTPAAGANSQPDSVVHLESDENDAVQLQPSNINSEEASTVLVPSEQLQRELQERGITSPYSGLQSIFLCRDLVEAGLGIGQLQPPRLRIVVGQPDVYDESSVRLRGIVHSCADNSSTFVINTIKLTVSFLPWGDDVLVANNSNGPITLMSVPGEFTNVEIKTNGCIRLHPGTWVVRDNNTSEELRIQQRRYSLYYGEDTVKRLASEGMGSAKRIRAHFASGYHIPQPAPGTSPDQIEKAIKRPVTTVQAADLAAHGIQDGTILTIVDETTGQLEYSIRYMRRIKRSSTTDIFRGVFRPEGDVSNGKAVVVKMVRLPVGNAHHVALQRALGYWKRELHAHRNLRHPCIASLVSYDSRLLVLTIEFKRARDLGSPNWRGKDATFNGNMDDACTILADISSALAYIADKGIVHNDVKAPNILYDGRAYLIDFGLSRVVADEAKDAGGGTPWYIAPEKRARVPQSDVWSLGVVMLYVMGEITLPDVGPAWDIYKANTPGSREETMRRVWFDK